MAGCGDCCTATVATNDRHWRRALWIALGINGTMFVGEMVAGLAANSQALQADALDFFGDTANYAISLGVSGMALGAPAPRFLKGQRSGFSASTFS